LFRGILAAILAAPFFVLADTVEVENKAYWICKFQKEVRTLRVFVNNSGTCSTHYSKQGEEKVVGSGRNQESCQNFLNNIKTNLEKSNWACRDVSGTRITASTQEDKPAQ